VSVRESLVAAAADYDGSLGKAVEDAIASMPDRGRNAVIVPLVFKNGEWTGVALQASGREARVRYSREEGLEVSRAA
jgi:hypothetical protein